MSSLSRYLPWALTLPAAGLLWLVHPVLGLASLLLFAMGVQDLLQTSHAIRRNYPLTGRFRYWLEGFRAELRQYFLEDDEQKIPFSRNERAIVYARSKVQNDKRGFGSIKDMYAPGTEWMPHSMQPVAPDPATFRVMVGEGQCAQPYAMSVFNVSGMSFGALSGPAIRALNKGAALGGFAHDTGEGSISVHHREPGGDLVWQIASGYFGCRTPEGRFDPERFAEQARSPQVKMIELKLSQGAKPGHGGVLPAAKVSAEIAQARGVPMGQDCISPARHSAFSTPVEMMHFIARLRELSGGKPVGMKLCVGQPLEWFAIVKAMLETGLVPTSLWSTVPRAALARRRSSLPTTWACRCATGCVWCTTAWWVPVCADAFASALRARSYRPFISRAAWRWGLIGATRRAASCSRWAAFNRVAAIPTNAPPAWPHKTRCASARWWWKTRRSGSPISMPIPCMRWASSWGRPA